MKVTFLGSGGAFTDYRVNYQNNALVEVDGMRLLVDCGVTACQSLRELGVHPTLIDTVVFTHLHADHASPEQLCWERMYTGPKGEPAGQRTRLAGPSDLMGPLMAGLEPYMGIWRDLSGRTRDDGVTAVIERVDGPRLERGPFDVRWFRVPHVDGDGFSKAAFGLDIRAKGRRLVWSGDTTFSPKWIREAAEDPDVHVIFHECSFSAPFRGTVHTHYSELMSLPLELREKIVLMHHTEVPDAQDPIEDGFRGAARRHDEINV